MFLAPAMDEFFFTVTLIFLVGTLLVAAFGVLARVFILLTYDIPWVERRRNARLFKSAQLRLAAIVMQADGHTTRRELGVFKELWTEMYGEKDCLRSLKKLKKLLKERIRYVDLCLDITRNIPYQSRLELLRTLFSIAAADDTSDQELSLIQDMAHYLNIQAYDFDSIFALFSHTWYGSRRQKAAPQDTPSAYWAYTALEIPPTATDEEVKKAYRRMAMKYHPDKVADMGRAAYRSATAKFQALGQAYETIKRERGIK